MKLLSIVTICLYGLFASAYAQTVSSVPQTATSSVSGISPLAHPGYIATEWYLPWPPPTVLGSGWSNPGASTAVCAFGYVEQQVTLSSLGVNVTTLSAGGNEQLAIYSNGSWGRPSSLVVATASISMAATGQKNGAITQQLGPGGYWFCANMDNATSIVVTYNTNVTPSLATVGATTQGAVISTSGATSGIKVAQTFGTWPTFTSGTAWTDATTAITPVIAMQIGSVP